MASRVENVIDEPLTKGFTREATLRIPARTDRVQVVLDRQRFENLSIKHLPICQIDIYVDGQYGGGVAFGGGVADNLRRPGMRYLWSTASWPIAKNSRVLRVVVRSREILHCTLHVDFFP